MHRGENSGSYSWVVEDVIVLGFYDVSLGRVVRRRCEVIVEPSSSGSSLRSV